MTAEKSLKKKIFMIEMKYDGLSLFFTMYLNYLFNVNDNDNIYIFLNLIIYQVNYKKKKNAKTILRRSN